MNLFDQLVQAVPKEKPSAKPPRPKPEKPDIRVAKTIARYKALFGNDQLTTSQVAGRAGVSHMGALKYLYALEKRGLIQRAGIEPRDLGQSKLPGRGQVIWEWKHVN